MTELLHPVDGIPEVVASERELTTAAKAIAAGQGPIGIDAERASGFRYGQRRTWCNCGAKERAPG